MARNIEIKAEVKDLEKLRSRVKAICEGPGEKIVQEDIFFHSSTGRFKLRILAPERGQLIYYRRPDSTGPKLSNYSIYGTSEPQALSALLDQAVGKRGVVKKTRWLYWYKNTRIHLDQVEGLGSFMELEVVMQPGEDQIEGEAAASKLMELLNIDSKVLIDGAYIDLLERKQRSA